MVAHFVCALFTGYITYAAHQPTSTLFSWHPTLMSLAFAFLMAEAILVFSPQSSLLQQKPRKLKVTCHWTLMVCSAVCAITGFAVIYYNKELREKPHLKSWHGILGIITVAYVIVQCCGGFNLLYPQFSAKFVRLASLKQMHATSGLFLFLLATFSLVTGMFSNWFTATVTGTSWYACLACPMLLLLIVTNQIKNAYLQKWTSLLLLILLLHLLPVDSLRNDRSLNCTIVEPDCIYFCNYL